MANGVRSNDSIINDDRSHLATESMRGNNNCRMPIIINDNNNVD
jgi:hypothetical protein